MNKKKDLSVLRHILPYLGRRWPLLVLSLLFAGVSVVLQLLVPIFFGDAIDCILGTGKVNFAVMGDFLLRALLCALISAAATYGLSLVNNRLTYRVVEELRNDAMHHIQRLPLSYFDAHGSGDIVSRVIADTGVLSDGLLLGLSQLFSGVLTVAVTLGFMLSKSVRISLLVIALTPLSFLIARFVSSRSFHLFWKQSELRGRQTAFIDETVGNQKVVRAFGYEQRASKRFAEMNRELIDCGCKASFFSSLTNPSTRLVNSVIYACVALWGVLLIPGGSLTVGGLTVLLSYANQYMKPLNDISSVVTELQNAFACASRIFDLLAVPPETADADGEAEEVSGDVEFADVSFRYVPERPLIEHFSLRAKPGMRVAIVGPTGCGKTTLINLLMRFYEVDSGEIRIDGKPERSLSRHSLRSCFGMVLQETWIKHGTVRENIAFGKPNATDEEILRAAKDAHCWEFIRRLPQGLDTVLTDESLSAGQKQLLCIARVMLCLPPMLILDEATSSIDTRTELRVQQAFDTLMQGRTSFVVAHRLSTIRDASLILVMRDGHIVEQGTHEELLAAGGFYKTLYESQFQRVS